MQPSIIDINNIDPMRLVKALMAIDDVLISREPEQQGPVDFYIGVERARRLFVRDTVVPHRDRMLSKYPLLQGLIISDDDLKFIDRKYIGFMDRAD